MALTEIYMQAASLSFLTEKGGVSWLKKYMSAVVTTWFLEIHLVCSHLNVPELGQTPHREGRRRRCCVVTLKQVDIDYCWTESKSAHWQAVPCYCLITSNMKVSTSSRMSSSVSKAPSCDAWSIKSRNASRRFTPITVHTTINSICMSNDKSAHSPRLNLLT